MWFNFAFPNPKLHKLIYVFGVVCFDVCVSVCVCACVCVCVLVCVCVSVCLCVCVCVLRVCWVEGCGATVNLLSVVFDLWCLR
jgi:hypothetical protein